MRIKARRVVGTLVISTAALSLSGCLVERTVTDGSGQVIYQEPEVHTPFESEQKKEAEINQKERELGWQ
jgi:hypothetical protein